MEVFASNVPQPLSEKGFKQFLRPHLLELSIQTFECQKPRDKNFGFITFLHFDDANRFLMAHGHYKSRPNARPTVYSKTTVLLKCMSYTVSFQKSNKPAHPHILRVLAKEEKDWKNHMRNKSIAFSQQQPQPPKVLFTSFKALSVSCGVWDYDASSDLVYVPQLSWEKSGEAKFLEGSMILKLESMKRIDFRYSSTHGVLYDSGSEPCLTFSMKEPPLFFEMIKDPLSDLLARLAITPITLTQSRRNGPNRHRLPCLDENHKAIAGNCLVWRIALCSSTATLKYPEGVAGGTMNDLKKIQSLPPPLHRHIPVRLWTQSYAESANLLRTELSSLNCKLPFEIKFQVLKLLHNCYLNPATILKLLPEIEIIAETAPMLIAAKAVRALSGQIDIPGPGVEGELFQVDALLELLRGNKDRIERFGILLDDFGREATAENVALIHRVKVTPSGILLFGPEPESQNRVLRKFPEHHGHFLRAEFCDEDGGQVRFDAKISNDRIFSTEKSENDAYIGRFKEVLETGISIADLKFDYLGYSHSSLRSKTVWMVAPFINEGELMSTTNIVRGLGDFTSITSPAKCAARIGQTFSDTPTAVPIHPSIVHIEADVERNGRVFSDGVGTMSRGFMGRAREKYSKNKKKRRTGVMPSCFQIRYSGAKGMLSLDNTLVGEKVVLRPSMIKFEGADTGSLEICEGALKPLPVYLNRQFVKILEDMGVEDEFFFKNQNKEVERLRVITANAFNASNFLTRQIIGESMHLPWLIKKLSSLGLDFHDDIFLCDVLEMAILVELRTLKHKTRIPIEQGWHLHGVMDTTGYLESGQVYIPVNQNGVTSPIIQNKILISRAPALHPGDVQLVDAVDIPIDSGLRHLHNCVVFSQKGDRDLPSMLSGGDLDGDRFYVIWDPAARPKRTYVPADYPRVPPVDIGRQVESSDMIDFFLLFMESDQLGRIAVLHRILADLNEEGTLSGDCVTLAELHSTAVDFSKTGVPVDMSRAPRYPKYRPDFEAPGPHVLIEPKKKISMETQEYRDPDEENDEDEYTSRMRYYKSDKVIGKLYRAIDETKIFNEIQERSKAESGPHSSPVIEALWKRIQQKCKLIQWERKKEWAYDVRAEYEESIQCTMMEYSDSPRRSITELEAIVGNIVGRTGAQSRKQRETSMSLKEKVYDDITAFVNWIIKDDVETYVHSEEALENSMACLAISLEETRSSRRKGQICSFKYLAAGICLKEVERYEEALNNPSKAVGLTDSARIN